MPSTPPDSSADTGLKSELLSMAKNATDYLQARGELLLLEGSEAVAAARKKFLKLAVGLFFFFVAYSALIIGLAALLGRYLEEKYHHPLANWTGVALVMALLHGAVSALLLMRSSQKSRRSFFEYSRSEWAKDQEWINKQSRPEKKS